MDLDREEYAINEACWKFVEVWDIDKFGPIGPSLFNNLKPMIREVVKEYLTKLENNPIAK